MPCNPSLEVPRLSIDLWAGRPWSLRHTKTKPTIGMWNHMQLQLLLDTEYVEVTNITWGIPNPKRMGCAKPWFAFQARNLQLLVLFSFPYSKPQYTNFDLGTHRTHDIHVPTFAESPGSQVQCFNFQYVNQQSWSAQELSSELPQAGEGWPQCEWQGYEHDLQEE